MTLVGEKCTVFLKAKACPQKLRRLRHGATEYLCYWEHALHCIFRCTMTTRVKTAKFRTNLQCAILKIIVLRLGILKKDGHWNGQWYALVLRKDYT